MTARLAIHRDVAASADAVLARLTTAGVDVEVVTAVDASSGEGPLDALRERQLDLALVGTRALRGSAANDLTMLAVLPREDPRDALIGLRDTSPLRALRRGARVAAGGARRRGFLRSHRPDVEVVADVSVDAGGWLERDDLDAAIVWAGEARRYGVGARTTELLDARAWPPEPGRGAVAVVGRHPIAEVTALDHLPTRTALRAELALMDALGLPESAGLGSLAQPSGRIMRLWAALVSLDGRRVARADLTGPLDEPEALGVSVARALEARGAGIVLAGSAG